MELDSLAVPSLILVAPPVGPGADLDVRAVAMQQMHSSAPMTGALCTAAAARIPETLVHQTVASSPGPVRLRHPQGIIGVGATVESNPDGTTVRSVSVVRTARRLMSGDAHIVLKS